MLIFGFSPPDIEARKQVSTSQFWLFVCLLPIYKFDFLSSSRGTKVDIVKKINFYSYLTFLNVHVFFFYR